MAERRLSVRMPAKLYKAARSKCLEYDQPLSEVVRLMLNELVTGETNPVLLEMRRQAITAIVVERPDGSDEVIPVGPQVKRKRKDKPPD